MGDEFLKSKVMNSLGPVLPILDSASPPVIDPWCGVTVDPVHTTAWPVRDGTTYFFCSMSCERQFSVTSDRFLMPQAEHSCLRTQV